jgi:hypothetical protein
MASSISGLLDEFFGRFALDTIGRIGNDGVGALRDIGPGLVIEKIDAVLKVGGDNTEACADKRSGHATLARGRLPDCIGAHGFEVGNNRLGHPFWSRIVTS